LCDWLWCNIVLFKAGYYGDDSKNICMLCDSSCKTCSDSGANNCDLCPDGRYLTANSCPKCDSTCKTCSGGLNT